MALPLNILWLVLSQWRADQTSAGGHPHVRVPNFEAFASSGVRVDGAVANHPFPHPSKASFLTGLPAEATGVAAASGPLGSDVRTIAHLLSSAGYATAHLGKWQLGRRDPTLPLLGEASARKQVPSAHRGGFSHWWGWDGGFLNEDPWVHGTDQEEPVRMPGFQADVLAERAVRLMAELPEPWFLCVHADAPHPPWTPEALGSAEKFGNTFPIPADVPCDPVIEARVRREFAASCFDLERADASFARIVAALQASGQSDRTVAAWFANHGDQHGSGGRLRKGWPHAASLRVPLALRAPSLRAGAVASTGLFGLVDLLPTSLGLAGVERASGIVGVDWSRQLASGRPLARSQRISLPIAPGLPMQCPFAWQGSAAEEGVAWTGEGGAQGGGGWAFPGWR